MPAMSVCEYCATSFPLRSKGDRQRFCSRSCLYTYRNEHPEEFGSTSVTLTCSRCGKDFRRQPSKVRGKAAHYCSVHCMEQATSPTLQSNPDLDRRRVCVLCGTPFRFKPQHTERAKYCSLKCSRTNHANLLRAYGPANPNYRHGQNRAAARNRAFGVFPPICIICGFDAVVEVHHVTPIRNGGTNEPENLAVLCPNHHRMADMGMIENLHLTVREALQHFKARTGSAGPS